MQRSTRPPVLFTIPYGKEIINRYNISLIDMNDKISSLSFFGVKNGSNIGL